MRADKIAIDLSYEGYQLLEELAYLNINKINKTKLNDLISQVKDFVNKNESTVELRDLIDSGFSWEEDSDLIPKNAPQFIKNPLFNWENSSYQVIEHCPEKLDIKKAYLDNITYYLPQYKNMTLEEIKKHAIIDKL